MTMGSTDGANQAAEVRFRLATPDEAAAVLDVIVAAAATLDDPDQFLVATLDFVAETFGPQGWVHVGEDEGGLLAVQLVRIPARGAGNLGHHLGLAGAELDRVVHMDTSAVHPRARGLGLHRRLLAIAEDEAVARGFRYVLATIHPDNEPSIRGFTRHGYEVVDEAEKYGGKPRLVLARRL